MSDQADLLAGGGPKLPTPKFETVGQIHGGIVTDVKKLEDRDPSGTLKTWPNGDSRFVYVLTIKDPVEGDVNIWARGMMITAIRDAAKTAGVTELVGNKISIRYKGDGEKKSAAFNAPKLFEAKIEKVATDDRW